MTPIAIAMPQVVLMLLVPIVMFLIGYFFGKHVGYSKRAKEIDGKY
ncbi:hypothetical protein [Mariniflexile sp. AS56]|nr:hypothetical protein [Mariniflexile sp. AS56]MDO7172675.1 hypothetical protein [Mariniflexile sp. AS56]